MKKKILQAFIQKFETEIEGVARSAKAAHEAATHEESKAEDSHDTRGVEASYLAGAQAARADELRQVVLEYKSMLLNLDETSRSGVTRVVVGSVVRVKPEKGAVMNALVALRGGGMSVEVDGVTYSVITPSSPIGEALFGAGVGDEVVIESKAGDRTYRIESIV